TETPDDLIDRANNHNGEIIFRKQQFDVFTNPNVDPLLEAIKPDRIVVYGVALDVCNAYAINGFLKRNTAPIQLVLDATQAIIPERGEELVANWQTRGVQVITTQALIDQ
ncbi:MAG: isochorismatase family protein, partial [Candidatus Latescibacteria bacterium]|nr:isochorismatase family protein [Candidatus Latescibacterota bacterium]